MAGLEDEGFVCFFSQALTGGGVIVYSMPLAVGEIDICFPAVVSAGVRRRVLQSVRSVVSECRLGPGEGWGEKFN